MSEFPLREIAASYFIRLSLSVERRTSLLPHPAFHKCTLIGRPGGGAATLREQRSDKQNLSQTETRFDRITGKFRKLP